MQARNRILLVFDEHYGSNGNVVYAATRGLIRQTGGTAEYRVFCKGRYRGPRFASRLGDVRVVSRRVSPIGEERTPSGWAVRLLARLRMCDAPSRWLTNIDTADRRLLRLLFEVERTRAVIVFTIDASFALKVARLAHIFSTRQVPHIVVVTPEYEADADTVRDLRWLRVKLLQDGSVVPPTNARPDTNRLPTALARFVRARKMPAASGNMVATPFDVPRPLSFLDAEFYPYQMNDIEATVSWADWIGPEQRLPDRVRDVVLFIRPDWVNCGSGTLFESLAAYFRRRDGLLIDIGIWPYAVPFRRKERPAKVAEQQRHIRSALYFSLRRTTSLFHALAQLRHAFSFWPRTVSNQVLLQNALAAKPRLVREVARHAKLTHIYLFHYFTYLFSKDLIAGRKFFLDTHDIQAINVVHNAGRNLFTRRGDQFHRLLAEEMRIVAKAHRAAFVSLTELALAARHVPAEKLDFIIPLPDITPCAPKPFAMPARLLIIAARNPGNERNLAWFLQHVWPKVIEGDAASGSPPLGKSAPQLDICGSIKGAFANVRRLRVQFHGVVEDLTPYYQRCDLVLLPVVTGGGVAIKTIEALLHERPVLATRHALRGLPQAIVETVGYANQPEEFAQAIRMLIGSPHLLEQRLDRSRRAAQLLRDQGFYERLTEAMDAVRLSDEVTQAHDPVVPDELAPPPLLADPLGAHAPRPAPIRPLVGQS